MPSTRLGASYNPSSSSQECYRHDFGRSQSITEGQGSVNESQTHKLCHSEADNTVPPSKRAETTTRSLSGHIQSQPEGLKQCISSQRVLDPCRSVEKLQELLPDCEKISGPSQHFKVNKCFKQKNVGKQPSTTQENAKKSPSSHQQQFQCEEAATSPEKRQRQRTSYKTLQPVLQNPKDSAGCHGKCISDGQNNDGATDKGGSQTKISEIISNILDGIPNLYRAINDVKSHISEQNSLICNNCNTNNLSLSQINKTLMCFERASRIIKTFNNYSSFRNNLNEQYTIIKELTEKYYEFNIDDIIEKRTKQEIDISKEDNKKFLDDISNLFTEVKTYTIALRKCFDTSQQEVSKLTMKLNQVISDNTRQTELWKELRHKKDMYEIEVINLIQSFQHEFRNSQRCSNSKMNDIEKLLKMSTPLNQN
ncbi:hypothetical protein O181_053887 [Austropuccinia psidii MF-1]|uniref:Uncharacterized protein n=1 Tax=Austropuccinia psidii MF-1 TaxID=1389203 RepID=A0A9Q3EAJ5_9BASI|nr:hypothetical protein [Austropuccinia psidii MF-1]